MLHKKNEIALREWKNRFQKAEEFYSDDERSVTCIDCGWHGRFGRMFDYDGNRIGCPRCYSEKFAWGLH